MIRDVRQAAAHWTRRGTSTRPGARGLTHAGPLTPGTILVPATNSARAESTQPSSIDVRLMLIVSPAAQLEVRRVGRTSNSIRSDSSSAVDRRSSAARRFVSATSASSVMRVNSVTMIVDITANFGGRCGRWTADQRSGSRARQFTFDTRVSPIVRDDETEDEDEPDSTQAAVRILSSVKCSSLKKCLSERDVRTPVVSQFGRAGDTQYHGQNRTGASGV
jgi:hypothetical protein